MNYRGDFPAGSTIDFKFTTVDSTGVPAALLGTPAVSCYKSNGDVQTVTGVTLTVNFDGITGLNHVRVETGDAFYAASNDFELVITAGTVGGSSVVGYVVGGFSIENRGLVRLSSTNTSSNDGTTVGGQIRRAHALVGGTKRSKDHSASNPTIVSRNEADAANLITQTRSVSGSTETITPS